MTDERLILVGRLISAATVAFGLAAFVLLLASDVPAPSTPSMLQELAGTIIVPAVVVVTLPKVPRNGSVWAFAVVGLSLGMQVFGDAVAWSIAGFDSEAVNDLAASVAPADLPLLAALGITIALSVWIPSFVLIPTLVLLLFPDGEFPDPRHRWRWIGPITIGLAGVGMVASALQYQPTSATPYDELATSVTPASVVAGIGSVLFILLAVVSIVGYGIKWKRAEGEVRLQYRWVGFAFFVFAIWSVVSIVIVPLSGSPINTIVSWIMIIFIPVAYSVSILKYRLYGIDVVISRSLTYAALVVFIGVVYVGIVVVLGQLLGASGDAGFGLSVVATAVVAIGFQPVRSRVERWANRVVYGKRATPYEVLARFSHRATEDDDSDVLGRIPRLIVDGTGASAAAVWVAYDDGFRAVSVWPESDSTRRLHGPGGFEDPEADVSLPVFHDGELLGGISLVAARGGVITPPERDLVANLADGLGLTLRNTRLTAELQLQVQELERSRDRVVSAADEARRSLERDLDSGPQQQLVAVKVKLGPLRRMAEQAGASRTAVLLADVEAQAGDAIQSVRDFAAGIYPPLLGAEGLAAALGQEARRAALPIQLEVDRVDRYPREVETAVYFSVLEALQNTAKYADASRATIRLIGSNGNLRFEVTDDGRGFDPAAVRRGAGLDGIADRIDTVGGSTTITSAPGAGTTVTGTVPVPARVTA